MTQIGFVGLGKMGGNMVHRIRRDSEHEVVAFDFDPFHRSQTEASFRLVWNAILNWNDLPPVS